MEGKAKKNRADKQDYCNHSFASIIMDGKKTGHLYHRLTQIFTRIVALTTFFAESRNQEQASP